MPNAIAHFDVSDGAKWLTSLSRDSFLASLGISARVFIDPENPDHIAMFVDVPEININSALESLQSPAVMARMIVDGVDITTFRVLLER